MNREQYLVYRTNNSPEPLYEYYKEKYKEGKPFLDVGTFFQAMTSWPHATEVYGNVLQYYDAKLHIVTIRDKTGKIIRFL